MLSAETIRYCIITAGHIPWNHPVRGNLRLDESSSRFIHEWSMITAIISALVKICSFPADSQTNKWWRGMTLRSKAAVCHFRGGSARVTIRARYRYFAEGSTQRVSAITCTRSSPDGVTAIRAKNMGKKYYGIWCGFEKPELARFTRRVICAAAWRRDYNPWAILCRILATDISNGHK
jgi:hypothetical protein